MDVTVCVVGEKALPNPPIGMTGLMGVAGITGIIGTTGIQGYSPSHESHSGISGFVGIVGIRGVTGVQGITGFYGDTGIQGYTGFYGTTGIQGYTGSGFTGISDSWQPNTTSFVVDGNTPFSMNRDSTCTSFVAGSEWGSRLRDRLGRFMRTLHF